MRTVLFSMVLGLVGCDAADSSDTGETGAGCPGDQVLTDVRVTCWSAGVVVVDDVWPQEVDISCGVWTFNALDPTTGERHDYAVEADCQAIDAHPG